MHREPKQTKYLVNITLVVDIDEEHEALRIRPGDTDDVELSIRSNLNLGLYENITEITQITASELP